MFSQQLFFVRLLIKDNCNCYIVIPLMNTINKCCDIVKELQNVFQEIKHEEPKSLEEEIGNRVITEEDKKKILKLFNFQKWPLYVKWVDEKLEESGELLQSFLEASGVESVTSHDNPINEQSEILTTKKEGKFKEQQSLMTQVESEQDLLENQNKKLSKQNMLLLHKYEQLKRKYETIMK